MRVLYKVIGRVSDGAMEQWIMVAVSDMSFEKSSGAEVSLNVDAKLAQT